MVWVHVLICTCVLLTIRRLYARVDTGTILGTVTDQSGGVIPGAKVTLINQGTSLSLAAHQNDPSLHEALGDLLLSQNQPQEAVKAYAECLRLDPGRVSALIAGQALRRLAGN